jgi:hypothetical protein
MDAWTAYGWMQGRTCVTISYTIFFSGMVCWVAGALDVTVNLSREIDLHGKMERREVEESRAMVS